MSTTEPPDGAHPPGDAPASSMASSQKVSENSNWRDRVAGHPLVVVVTAVIAASTVTFGVVNYFNTQSSGRALADKQRELTELQQQLSRIDRHLGKDAADSNYFDVRRILISRLEMAALPKDVRTIGNGEFFVSLPDDPTWKYAEASEYDILAETLGKDFAEQTGAFSEMLKQSPVHIWRGPQQLALRPQPQPRFEGVAPSTITLMPYLAVQARSIGDLRKATGSVVDSMQKEQAELEAKSSRLDSLLAKITAGDAASKPTPGPSGGLVTPPAASAAANARGSAGKADAIGADDQRLLKSLLDELFAGDVVGMVLVGLTQSVTQFPQLYQHCHSNIVAAEKKDNVLYLHTRLSFDAVPIAGIEGPKDVTLEQEFFVVSNLKTLYIVKRQAPYWGAGTGIYPWVEKMLIGGLRIPWAA